MPDIKTDNIISTKLYAFNTDAKAGNYPDYGCKLNVYPVKSDLNLRTVTYNTPLQLDSAIYQGRCGQSKYEIDLTDYYKKNSAADKLSLVFKMDYVASAMCFVSMHSTKADAVENRPYIEIKHLADETFPDTSKVNIHSAPAAVFKNQDIVTINSKSQMTASLGMTSLTYNTATARLDGVVTFTDGAEKLPYMLMINLCQSHLDISGQRSIVGGWETGSNANYELISLRIEENCNSLTLMPANYDLEGKTVITIGILNKTTKKIYYVQQAIEGLPFSTLYDHAYSKESDLGFNQTATASEETYALSETSDIARETEKSYLLLKKMNGFDSLETTPNDPLNLVRSTNDYTDNALLNNPARSPLAERAAANGMRENLIRLQDYKTVHPLSNGDSCICGLHHLFNLSELTYPILNRWTYRWVGLKSTDNSNDQMYPYFYAKYGSALAGTDNIITTIVLADIRMETYYMDFKSTMRIAANMDIAYNKKTKQLSIWEMNKGNGIIDELYMAEHLKSTTGARFGVSAANTRVTEPNNVWDVLGMASFMLGFANIPYLALADTALMILEQCSELTPKQTVKPNKKYEVERGTSHDTLSAEFGNLYSAQGPIKVLGDGDGDYAQIVGKLNQEGTFLTYYFFMIKMSCVAYGKYDY